MQYSKGLQREVRIRKTWIPKTSFPEILGNSLHFGKVPGSKKLICRKGIIYFMKA
jgi:hypothetical protein